MQEDFPRLHDEGSTVADLLTKAATILTAQGVETARLDAEVLLGHALGVTRAGVYARLSTQLTSLQWEKFWSLIERRGQRQPLSYLTGVREFWSLEFMVS